MKTTLTITERGVITLPAKLRQALGLTANDQLIAETTPDGLLLRPAVALPIEMYTARTGYANSTLPKPSWPPCWAKNRTDAVRIFLDANILFSAARAEGAMSSM